MKCYRKKCKKVLFSVLFYLMVSVAYVNYGFTQGEVVEELEFKPQIGSVWDYKASFEITSKRQFKDLSQDVIDSFGPARDFQMFADILFSAEVENERDPTRLTLTYKDIDMRLVVNGQELSPPDSITNKGLEGKAIELSIFTRDNSVIEDFSGINDELLPYAKNMLNIAKFFYDFPSQTVKMGDKWNSDNKFKLAPIGSLEIIQISKNEYSFKAVKNINGQDCAYVRKDSSITQESAAVENNTIVSGRGDGYLTTDIYFDLDDGKLVRSEIESSVDSSFDIAGDVLGQGKLLVNTVQKSRIEMLAGRNNE